MFRFLLEGPSGLRTTGWMLAFLSEPKAPDERCSPNALPAPWRVPSRLPAGGASALEQRTFRRGSPSCRQGLLSAPERRSRHTPRPLAQGCTRTPGGTCMGRPREDQMSAAGTTGWEEPCIQEVLSSADLSTEASAGWTTPTKIKNSIPAQLSSGVVS